MKTWKILFVVFIAAVFGFGVLPLNKSIDDLKEENKKLFLEKQEKIAELKELSPSSDNGEALSIDIETKIPRKLSQAELAIDIENALTESGLNKPEEWYFSVTKDVDLNLSKIGVFFPIKGSRGSIYNFLKLVENNPRFMSIEALSVKTLYENNTPLFEMNVSLYAFSQE